MSKRACSSPFVKASDLLPLAVGIPVVSPMLNYKASASNQEIPLEPCADGVCLSLLLLRAAKPLFSQRVCNFHYAFIDRNASHVVISASDFFHFMAKLPWWNTPKTSLSPTPNDLMITDTHDWIPPMSSSGGVQSGPFSPDRAANVKSFLFRMQHDSDPGMFSGRSLGSVRLERGILRAPTARQQFCCQPLGNKKKKSWLFKCDCYRLSSGTQFQSYHAARQVFCPGGQKPHGRTHVKSSRIACIFHWRKAHVQQNHCDVIYLQYQTQIPATKSQSKFLHHWYLETTWNTCIQGTTLPPSSLIQRSQASLASVFLGLAFRYGSCIRDAPYSSRMFTRFTSSWATPDQENFGCGEGCTLFGKPTTLCHACLNDIR